MFCFKGWVWECNENNRLWTVAAIFFLIHHSLGCNQLSWRCIIQNRAQGKCWITRCDYRETGENRRKWYKRGYQVGQIDSMNPDRTAAWCGTMVPREHRIVAGNILIWRWGWEVLCMMFDYLNFWMHFNLKKFLIIYLTKGIAGNPPNACIWFTFLFVCLFFRPFYHYPIDCCQVSFGGLLTIIFYRCSRFEMEMEMKMDIVGQNLNVIKHVAKNFWPWNWS